MKLLAVFLLLVLAFPLVPVSAMDLKVYPPGQNPISQATVGLNSTTGTQVTNFNPSTIPGYFGKDIGPVSWVTSPTGLSWNVTKQDSMTLGLPTVAGLGLPNTKVFYNTTITSWQLSSAQGPVNLFFKANAYSDKISIQTTLTTPQQVCIGFSSSNQIVQETAEVSITNHTIVLLPTIKAGSEEFSWTDILPQYLPTWNSQTDRLCLSLPAATTNIDPLAIDGSNHTFCNNTTSCSITITTAVSPDPIIILAGLYQDSSTFTIADTSSLTWHVRVTSDLAADTREEREYCAIASGTLSGDTITITGPAGSYFALVDFGVSGANTSGCTSSTYDPNPGMPYTDFTDAACPASGAGGNNPCIPSYSSSNANDFEYLASTTTADAYCATADTGFTTINACATGGVNSNTEYQIVSSTQSGVLLKYGNNYINLPQRWASLADAIQQAASSVTQPIKITTLPAGAPTATISISGCSVSNATFSADGFTHTYSGVSASCSITLTNPATCGVGNSYYCFDISPHPTVSATLTVSTCSSGTCPLFQNNTYNILKNTASITPLTPSAWDGSYKVIRTGPFLSVTNNTEPGGCSTTEDAGVLTCTLVFNYAGPETVRSSHGSTKIGNTWIASPAGSNTVSPTTGGNTYTFNFVQSTGGVYDPSSYNWLLALPFLLLAFIAGKKL